MSRNLFDELVEGFDALAAAKQGKRTLRTHVLAMPELTEVSAQELIQVRERLSMSQGVFAQYLRTNKRTLENWEQGRSKPNAQAQILIRLVKKHPETIGYLAELS